MFDALLEKENNTIGNKIRDARKNNKLNLASFSILLKDYGVEIKPASISAWENNFSVPNAYQFLAVCNALKMTECRDFYLDRELNEEGKQKVDQYIRDLIDSGNYKPEKQEDKMSLDER